MELILKIQLTIENKIFKMLIVSVIAKLGLLPFSKILSSKCTGDADFQKNLHSKISGYTALSGRVYQDQAP